MQSVAGGAASPAHFAPALAAPTGFSMSLNSTWTADNGNGTYTDTRSVTGPYGRSYTGSVTRY